MEKKHALTILLALIVFIRLDVVSAQDTYIPPSPTSISMIKGAGDNVNLYTGKASINIPIYTVKSGSLSTSINLKYIGGAGLKVQEIPSEVGLGWALMAGGVISETIRGGSDDEPGYSGYFNNPLVGHLNSSPASTDFQQAFVQMGDTEPDIYNSTIGGRIVFDHNKQPHFINEQGFTILQSGIISSDQIWIIVDSQGNKYYFGETSASRERYVQTTNSGYQSLSSKVHAWRLTKMTSPNGDVITFEYGKSGQLTQQSYYSFAKTYNSISNAWQIYDSPTASPSEEIHLSRITTGNAIIDFLYQDRDDFLYSKALSQIKVQNAQGALVTKYVFQTDYFKSEVTNPVLRLKLKAVKQCNNSSNDTIRLASFGYNELENLPARNSEKFDHWGYYNNNATGKYFLSEGANKNADLSKCQANILTNIQWATGGVTHYTYQLNSYRRNGIDYNGGGLRVGAVSEVNSDNSTLTTTYDYTTTASGQSFTSGLVHSLFDITSGYTINSTRNGDGFFSDPFTFISEQALPLSKAIDLDDITVGYSRVTVTNPDQSSEIYNFRDYFNFPDEIKNFTYIYRWFADPRVVESFADIGAQDKYNGFIYLTSNALQRGLIISKDFLNSQHAVIKSINYKYDTFYGAQIPGAQKQVLGTYVGEGDWAETHKMFFQASLYWERVMSVRVTEVKEEDFFPNQTPSVRSMILTNTYKGSTLPYLLSKQIHERVDGSIKSVWYNYPSDMVALGKDPNNVYSDMVSRNMLSPLVEQIDTVAGSQVLLTKTNYDKFNTNNGFAAGIIMPANIEVKVGANPSSLTDVFNSYDFQGNLIESQPAFGAKITYIYSYNNRYPVARIVNANRATIESILGGANAVNTFSSLANPSKAVIDAFLEPLNKPYHNFQVTSSTYKPLIGMTSQTDPRGKTTFYEYDGFQRLEVVRDQNNKIVQSYTYHYKQP